MVTCYMILRDKNDDYYHKGREGGGQKDMIEIIISENGDNDGRPLRPFMCGKNATLHFRCKIAKIEPFDCKKGNPCIY